MNASLLARATVCNGSASATGPQPGVRYPVTLAPTNTRKIRFVHDLVQSWSSDFAFRERDLRLCVDERVFSACRRRPLHGKCRALAAPRTGLCAGTSGWLDFEQKIRISVLDWVQDPSARETCAFDAGTIHRAIDAIPACHAGAES
jgi:hypothetical protein